MSEDAKQVVQRYYEEIFGRKNISALDGIIAPDFVGHSAGHGPFSGEDMRRDIGREHDEMPEDETIIEEQIAYGNRVVTRWTYRWTHDVSLFGEEPTGEWLSIDGVHIDQVEDGMITRR
jgi:predicted ester cyclase